jgi:hypothetical protein
MKLIKDDGWNTDHVGIEDLIDQLNKCAELKYELENCIVGSYYEEQMENGADLKEAVLCLAMILKETAEGIKE